MRKRLDRPRTESPLLDEVMGFVAWALRQPSLPTTEEISQHMGFVRGKAQVWRRALLRQLPPPLHSVSRETTSPAATGTTTTERTTP